MKKNLFYFALILLSLFSDPAKAQYTKILDFTGAANGNEPHGDLISDGTFLYGMTYGGGINNFGTIFKIKPDGTEYSKLFDFDSTTDGGAYGSLISDGIFLYGMTPGTIFKIRTDGTGYLKLLAFTGTNGGGAMGSLISDGTFLYGMTSGGGANICDQYGGGCGVLFKIRTDGMGYSKLHDFSIANGNNPRGSLIYDGTFLYGMTWEGGANCQPSGCGVAFKIKPDGSSFSKLLDFDISTGAGPFGSFISDGTFLYGMTNYTIFKIRPDVTGFFKLLDFTGANGRSINASLFSDGSFLYGMTREGGASTNCGSGCGTIFKIKPDGTGYTKLLDFTGENGRDPMGTLISDGTSLYGMTRTGGANNMGVIFSLSLKGTAGVNENAKKGIEVIVFPNPTAKTITINITAVNPNEDFTLRITNSLGKTVYSETLKEISSSFTKEIDLGHLAKGIYFVELVPASASNTSARKVTKLILQ